MSVAAAVVDAAPEKSVNEQLDALFAPWNRTDAPGLVVGVAYKGEVIYRRGFGMASLETATALTPTTRMRIGSVTKHFTALLALLLAEEGKLDLDATIRTYVPELTGPGGDPTVRELLEHRGGSRCYLDVGMIAHGLAAPPNGYALTTQARQTGRNFAPGEAMIYNNGGYQLVSVAAQRVGGAVFEELLRQRLFAPLGMNDSLSAPTDHEIVPGIATLHTPGPKGGWRRGLFPSEENRGEGAIYSSADDMLRWTAHLRRRDRFGSAATWAALTTPRAFPGGEQGAYSLGLLLGEYRGLNILHHSGGVVGGTSQMLTFPDDDLDVIIIANGAPAASPVRLAQQVADIILADRLGPEPAGAPTEGREGLVGDWWSPETGMLYSLSDAAGVLKVAALSPLPQQLELGADGSLVLPPGGVSSAMFQLTDDGQGLNVTFGGRTVLHSKVAEADGDVAAFAKAAAGRYFSADADAEAEIVQQGEGLTIRFHDSFGQLEAVLVPLGADVASVRPALLGGSSHGMIGLERDGGEVTGFRVSTSRTRNLEFVRRPNEAQAA